MTMVSDLSQDLVEEILCRVPITSLRAVRSTCRRWNCLSKDPSFIKNHCNKCLILYDFKVSLMRVNLEAVHNHKDGLVDLPIKQIGKLDQIEISNIFHSNGLLLCVTRSKNNNMLVVWNPYSGQTRLIKPRNTVHRKYRYGIGYDNNNNHKILMFSDYYGKSRKIDHEIYYFKSNSQRVFDVALDWRIPHPHRVRVPCSRQGLSLKGNIYIVAQEILNGEVGRYENILLGFDFTREKFGPHLPLPFQSYGYDSVLLSVVKEEQLAVLFKSKGAYEMKIWITTKIEPNAVSWSNFLKFDMIPFSGRCDYVYGSFLVEKKKVAVICDRDIKKMSNYKAHIFGEDGYYREVDLGQSKHQPFMCSYVPSSVQIQQILHTIGKRKKRDY